MSFKAFSYDTYVVCQPVSKFGMFLKQLFSKRDEGQNVLGFLWVFCGIFQDGRRKR